MHVCVDVCIGLDTESERCVCESERVRDVCVRVRE